MELKEILPYLSWDIKGCEYEGGSLYYVKKIDVRSEIIVWGSFDRGRRERLDCKPVLKSLDILEESGVADLIREELFEVDGHRNFKYIGRNPIGTHVFRFEENEIGWEALPHYIYRDFFFKYHFDVQNLIDRGLAVEIKTKSK